MLLKIEKVYSSLLKTSEGHSSTPFLCLPQKLSLAFFIVTKLLPHKSPEWSSLFTDPEAKFSSLDHKSNIVHCKLSVLGSVLVSFFNMELFSFPSTAYWKDFLFSIVHSCLLCQWEVSHRCVGGLWAFYLVLSVYISVWVPISYCLNVCTFVVQSEVQKVDSSSFIFFFFSKFLWLFTVFCVLTFPYKFKILLF